MDYSNIGKIGEDFAVSLLSQNHSIIGTNFHSRYGEIDIIAQKENGTFIFLEVKTRKKNSFANGRDSVTPKKQSKIIKTALVFLESRGLSIESVPASFDVIEIIMDEFCQPENYNYIENAFDAVL